MPSLTQSIGGGTLPATSRHIHEGAAPATETQIMTLGSAGIIFGGHQIDATLYVEAVTVDVTAVLYGRILLRDSNGTEIIGAWKALKTLVATAGTSAWEQVPLASLISGPNQFKIQWSGNGSGATSKVALTLS